MPQTSNILNSIPDSPPNAITIGMDIFNRGVITLINETKLPRNALKQAQNLTLAEDGAPKVRPGIGWYGTAPSASAIDGAEMYTTATDTTDILAVAGGIVYRSQNDGLTWTALQTSVGVSAVFTAGKKVHMIQANNYMFLFNGWDNIVRYDGTATLVTYTALATPSGSSLTKTGLGGATIYTYRYRVSAVNEVGYTIASAAMTIGVDRLRSAFDATNLVNFSWSVVTGAVRYDIYVGQTNGEEYYIDSTDNVNATTYVDKGLAVEQVSLVAPESNTTQGPRCADMAMVGSRIYATNDRDFPYRVWISGAGRFAGQFSSAYDATYIDLQKGSQYKPVKVVDYRDGKGTPLATVWCKSKDGRGCVWQGTLESYTVGSITIPVPNFYKLPGSRGTEAPDSVVNVLNDYMYYNSQAFFNLGSRAQFLNLLSTDEASANIRPNVKRIRPSAAPKIAGHFSDARVLMSVPIDSDVNNTTMQYDTEHKAWLPEHFTVGFERFFTYADNTSNSTRHLLCWKPGDTRLSEISDSIKGDYGAAFQTSLVTGLMHINPKNRFQFLWVEEGEVEVAEQTGTVTIELSGITREEGFKKIGTRNIRPSSVKYSWTRHMWGDNRWSAKSLIAVNYSEPSTKRYFNVQDEVNAFQYRVTTNSLDAAYIGRTLQVNGTATEGGKPLEWELFD